MFTKGDIYGHEKKNTVINNPPIVNRQSRIKYQWCYTNVHSDVTETSLQPVILMSAFVTIEGRKTTMDGNFITEIKLKNAVAANVWNQLTKKLHYLLL